MPKSDKMWKELQKETGTDLYKKCGLIFARCSTKRRA